MKNKVKRIAAILCVSVMVCGMGIGVQAEKHECAFSYMGNDVTSTSNVGSHPYTRYNEETGQPETVTCYISAKTESQVWKCACGATQYRNSVTRTYHSVCGL